MPTEWKSDYTPLIAIIVIAIAVIALYTYFFVTAPPPPPNQVTLIVSGPGKFSFSPSSLTIGVGDSVTWVNRASFPFGVISDNASDLFDSGSISVGASYVHVFDTPGTFHYHSNIPNATGTVTVESLR